jgi:tryptophan synthase alpha chain
MSVAGITGERDKLPDDLPKKVAHLKELSGIPVLVGFGIKTPEQVRQVCSVADGAIVGTAFVRTIAKAQQQHQSDSAIIEAVETYAKELLTGLR